MFLLLLDLSAAFDTVNHSLLLSRLENSFGITGTVLQWFHSYLTVRSQFVEINDTKSSVRDLTVDVPQGSVLGPILYLLYTAPLAEIIRSHGLVYHFYADDTQLYISFKDCDVDVARLRVENCVADMSLDGLKRAETQSRQNRNYAYLLEVPYSSTLQLLQYR